MVLKRYTKSIDGTIPAQALLYNDEELLGSQDGVGIYDGLQKSPDHQNGTVYATSHRLLYIDAHDPTSASFAIDLSSINQTEYYAGLFTSSAKVTLHISSESQVASEAETTLGDPHGFETWECQVCAYRNPPGLSPAASRICGLCGVPREAVPSDSTPSTRHFSSSLPSSGVATPSRLPPPLPQADPSATDSIACPACTFLNHISLRQCELCDTDLPHPARSRREMKSAPASRPSSPERVDDPAARFIKVSFRKGGDKTFYATLKRGLKTKAWETAIKAKASTPSLGGSSTLTNTNNGGISGILRTVESSTQERESDINDALQDLEALMVKAKDMVRLAAELNEKLTAASATSSANSFPFGSSSTTIAGSAFSSSSTTLVAGSEPEEATFIRSSLSQLGLQLDNAPVTQDMMKDERKWFEELARELARVLQGSSANTKRAMMSDRGIIALDEVWGGWNRARGVALIPPSTFLQVLPLLPQYTHPPIHQRKFTSGFQVLHTPPYAPTAFATRLAGFLVMNGPKTTMDVALDEGLAVALVREMIEAGEGEGDFCRDDVGEAAIVGGGSGTGVEIRWWPNVFVGYVWDGQD